MLVEQFKSPFVLAAAGVVVAASLAAYFGYSRPIPMGGDCPTDATDATEPAGSQNYLCDQQYALCTSAPCVPTPGNPKTAACFCDVEEGKNMVSVPCENAAPSTDSNGIRTVYSAFSLDQFYTGKQSMKCESGMPWTWCLNKVCTVYPYDPSKAICTCDVVRTGESTTLGGDCNPATCSTAYWSAAPLEDFEEAAEFMTKKLGLEKSPVKWCE